MRLSAQMFDEVLKLSRRQPGRGIRENRGSPRLKLPAEAIIVPVTRGATPIPTTLCNISVTGIAMLASHPMAVGTRFCVRLPRMEGPPFWVQCVVKRWRPKGVGAYIIGSRFTHLICSDEGEGPQLIRVEARKAAQSPAA